ncbi:response regulator [Flavisolibacter nicotianae]|uniref:response regulator n=1 Tax=Flavisolibacter nicotianae TaxID=2364882 RepID=UPI000EAB4AF7|nr:response regulator transcription factor [Flavisolibacter nicotianae]
MSITLLITDDSTILLEAWKYILSFDTRFQVIATCTSGEEAVEQAQKLRPDIVIMDINLPGMNGIEATALIRKSVPETKVLGYSLHSELTYAWKFMAAGAAGYIEKTASIKEMTDTLVRIYHNQPPGCKERKSEMQMVCI